MKKSICIFSLIIVSSYALIGQIGKDSLAPSIDAKVWVNLTTESDALFIKHELTVLNFWATWCQSCLAAFPQLTEMYYRFSSLGVQIVGLSNEYLTKEDLDVFARTNKIPFPLAADSSSYKDYNVSVLPHFVVVDQVSTILWEGSSLDMLEEILTRYFSSSFASVEEFDKANIGNTIEFSMDGVVGRNSLPYNNVRAEFFDFPLKGDSLFVAELTVRFFNPQLILLDKQGQILATGRTDAREAILEWRANSDGEVTLLVATSRAWEEGDFQLSVKIRSNE